VRVLEENVETLEISIFNDKCPGEVEVKLKRGFETRILIVC
jgi:hypothetical protein